MEEPEYYRAINKMYRRIRERRLIEKLIEDIKNSQSLINKIKKIKTVREFLDKF